MARFQRTDGRLFTVLSVSIAALTVLQFFVESTFLAAAMLVVGTILLGSVVAEDVRRKQYRQLATAVGSTIVMVGSLLIVLALAPGAWTWPLSALVFLVWFAFALRLRAARH